MNQLSITENQRKLASPDFIVSIILEGGTIFEMYTSQDMFCSMREQIKSGAKIVEMVGYEDDDLTRLSIADVMVFSIQSYSITPFNKDTKSLPFPRVLEIRQEDEDDGPPT